jgi:hypothetical protein
MTLTINYDEIEPNVLVRLSTKVEVKGQLISDIKTFSAQLASQTCYAHVKRGRILSRRSQHHQPYYYTDVHQFTIVRAISPVSKLTM